MWPFKEPPPPSATTTIVCFDISFYAVVAFLVVVARTLMLLSVAFMIILLIILHYYTIWNLAERGKSANDSIVVRVYTQLNSFPFTLGSVVIFLLTASLNFEK